MSLRLDLSLFLGIYAAFLHGAAYIIYNRQTKLGQSSPNAASWSVWTFMAILNAVSFRAMSDDWISSLQFFTGSVACAATFLYVLCIGSLEWPSRKELRSLGIGLVAVTFWYVLGDKGPVYANLLGLGAFLISFKPTLDGVYKKPSLETSRPWVIWTLAFGITVLNIIFRHGLFTWSLVSPAVLLICHGIIAVLSRPARKRQLEALAISA